MPKHGRSKRDWFATTALLLVLGSTLSLDLKAQVAGGEIEGTITDPTGAVIFNVRVSLRNLETNVVTAVSTNKDGLYTAPNLLPGKYELMATSPGFGRVVANDIEVTVGGQESIDLTMKIGEETQTVEVTSAARDVETATSTLSGVVGANTVRELPLNGRDWTQLATLQPGVATVRSQQGLGQERGQRGLGTQMTISGQRPQQNNYRLDGANINDYSNGGPGSVLGVNLGTDAVAEFSVLTSTYSAEYGRTSGGVINATTRSGTNAFHGDVYLFERNSAADARNYFDDLSGPPPFRRHQFGGAVGGALRKDHTFIFGDYEGIRQSLGITHVDSSPTEAARNGQLSDGTTVVVDPAVIPFLGFFPLPNGPTHGNFGDYSFAGQDVTNENFVTTRLDHKISDRDSLFGTYMFDQGKDNNPDAWNAKLQQFRSRRQLVTLEETHNIRSNFINTVRGSVSRIRANIQESIQALNPLAADSDLGTVPGRDAAQINVAGLTNFTGGLGGVPNYNFYWTSWQGYDDAFLTHGIHSIRFGVSFEHIQDNIFATSNPNGVFKFTDLSHFLTNQPKSLSAALPGSLSPRNVRQSVLGLYFQDDVRLFHNLTLNLGVRYEMATVPTETHGKLSNLRNISDPAPTLGDPYYSNPTLRNFEPRIGLAWDPTGDGKTAVRAGFGMFDVLPLPYQFELGVLFATPFFQLGQVNGLPQGSFPSIAFSSLNGNTLRGVHVQTDPKRSYVYQYNLNIQRELLPSLTVELAYVGSRGIHQPFRADTINMVLPVGKDAQGHYFWPTPQGSGTLINPNFSREDGLLWAGDSYYNSLQVRATKRMGHGFQIGGSYTWGKSIDTGSAGLAGDAFANSLAVLPFFDPQLRRGLSDFHLNHNVVINYLWELPNAHGSSGLANWLASGWQLGGIVQASTGSPFSPIMDGDPLGLLSSDAFSFPNAAGGPGCANPVNSGNPTHYIKTECFSFPNPSTTLGTARRNSLIGPGLVNVDMSVFKNNRIPRISETMNVQLRLEAFNVFNRANFAAPFANNFLFDEGGSPIDNAGQITETQTTSRQIQLAVKFIW